MERDFTYVDDIAVAGVRVADHVATPDPAYRPEAPNPAVSNVPYRVFNIGNHTPVKLLDFIACIERTLGRQADKRLLPMQDGDVPSTYADVDALHEWVGFAPATPIETGIGRFVAWYRDYYRV
jgi:UDP-glucuronate 4-epimerase